MMLKNLIWQEVQTIVAAGIFAVLIWIYAEGENVKERDLWLDVRFVPPAGQELLIEPSQVPQPVRVSLRCSTSQWAEIRKLGDQPLEMVVTADPGGVEQTVNLAERLRADARFAGRGIEVREVRAETVRVHVERLESHEVRVEVVAGELELAGPASVEPEKVRLRVPVSVAGSLEQVRVEAVLSGPEFDPAKLPENERIEREVPVRVVPGDLRYVGPIEPERVVVRFAIRRRLETLKIPRMQVLTVLPPGESLRYGVEVADEHRTLLDVEVTGPREAIERLRRGQVTPWAALRLTAEELDRGITSKAVEVKDLPAGVTLSNPATPPVVSFRVVPVSAGGRGGGAGGMGVGEGAGAGGSR